jgi:hypothetical protein
MNPSRPAMSIDFADVWSCGGGTQSGAIATLIGEGKLPKPDYAFMTDTGRERASTWPFVEGYIRPQLRRANVDLHIIQATDYGAKLDIIYTAENGKETLILPGFTTVAGFGKLSPFCSGKWKRDVGERWIRAQGIERARNWIGISRDEPRRIKAPHRAWLDLWYPLVFEVPMTRERCRELIRSNGWTDQIPHSACYMCPNHADSEWVDMKQNWPADFDAACRLEEEARIKDPHFYLHPSCVPLAQVDFFQQRSMLPERGCTGECMT